MHLSQSVLAVFLALAISVIGANPQHEHYRRASPGSLRSNSEARAVSSDSTYEATLNARDGDPLSNIYNTVVGGGGGGADPISIVVQAATSLLGSIFGQITGTGEDGGAIGALMGGSPNAKGLLGSLGAGVGIHRRADKVDYGPQIDKLETVIAQLKKACAQRPA